MRIGGKIATAALFVCSASIVAGAQSLPPDVRANHWAIPAVQSVLKNNVMSVSTDQGFHGEARVTRKEAVMALAKFAKALEDNSWRSSHSAPVSDKVIKTLSAGDWAKQPVTRYGLASILTRFGDYAAAGISRPKPGARDLGKSIVLPEKPAITIAKTNPAYSSLTYLADNHMI